MDFAPENETDLNLEQSIGDIPNNFQFVHISNPGEEDEELVKIEDSKNIPLNFHFWDIMMHHVPKLGPYLSENIKCCFIR